MCFLITISSPSAGIGSSQTLVSLLDNSRENSTYKSFNGSKTVWTGSQRNCFRRVKCGIYRHHGEQLRFLTLTSASEMLRPIGDVFDCMKTMIRRYTPYRLKKEHYIDDNGLRYYYGNKNPFDSLVFDYLKIKTTEGNGVLHILFFGDYLPYNFLCDIFSYYSGFAWDLDIRRVGGKLKANKDKKKVSYYVMNQYVTSQKDANGYSAYNGYNAGWNWIFRGFTNWYNQFVNDYSDKDYLEREQILSYFLMNGKWKPPPIQIVLGVVEQNSRLIWDGGLYNEKLWTGDGLEGYGSSLRTMNKSCGDRVW